MTWWRRGTPQQVAAAEQAKELFQIGDDRTALERLLEDAEPGNDPPFDEVRVLPLPPSRQ